MWLLMSGCTWSGPACALVLRRTSCCGAAVLPPAPPACSAYSVLPLCCCRPAAEVANLTADTTSRPPLHPPPAAPLSATYQSSAGNTFVLNTTMLNFTEASRSCNMYGWHLAMFDSRQEQNEVEAFFTSSSYLLPTFHRQFWMGLIKRNGATWSFMDPSINTTYTNYNKPATPGNLCGAAFFANRVGSPSAWGWGDNSCASKSVFVCRNTGEPGATWCCLARHSPWYTY